MGKVIKSTIAYKKEDLFEVEAGPISIILNDNLITSSKEKLNGLKDDIKVKKSKNSEGEK
tara:strand:+ start:140 stop:319 length:180 start_codon:yes stop_codon:yes gene_type:complete